MNACDSTSLTTSYGTAPFQVVDNFTQEYDGIIFKAYQDNTIDQSTS